MPDMPGDTRSSPTRRPKVQWPRTSPPGPRQSMILGIINTVAATLFVVVDVVQGRDWSFYLTPVTFAGLATFWWIRFMRVQRVRQRKPSGGRCG